MENEITLSTRWNYVGMKTVLVESECLSLVASGSARFTVPGHPEEVDEPFRDTFRGLPLPLPPPPNWVKGRLWVGGGGGRVGGGGGGGGGRGGAVAAGDPLTVPVPGPGPCGSCGCGD